MLKLVALCLSLLALTACDPLSVTSHGETCWYAADGHPCVMSCTFTGGWTTKENNVPAVDAATGEQLTCFADESPCAEMCP
jgi:hypothetical protein